MKFHIKKLLIFLFNIKIIKFLTLYFNYFTSDYVVSINYKNIIFYFVNSNLLTKYRIKTFLTKEPETLKWIDNFKEGSYFWDVGANIGLYSIYAAKTKNCNVFSFEPSFLNLELLSKNIYHNKLEELVTIAPISLSDKNSISFLNFSYLIKGAAHTTFGHEIDQKGNKLNKLFRYKSIGFKSDDFISFYNLNYPDYLKIDVDGIEHLILNGGEKLLSNVKEVLIEVNYDFELQFNSINMILKNKGFKLTYESTNSNIKQSNQIWKKNL